MVVLVGADDVFHRVLQRDGQRWLALYHDEVFVADEQLEVVNGGQGVAALADAVNEGGQFGGEFGGGAVAAQEWIDRLCAHDITYFVKIG